MEMLFRFRNNLHARTLDFVNHKEPKFSIKEKTSAAGILEVSPKFCLRHGKI